MCSVRHMHYVKACQLDRCAIKVQDAGHTLLRLACAGKGCAPTQDFSELQLQAAECSRMAIAQGGYVATDRQRAFDVGVQAAP